MTDLELRNYMYETQVTVTPQELRKLEHDNKNLHFDHKMMHLDGTDTYDVYKRIINKKAV